MSNRSNLVPGIDDLIAAKAPCCVPYMDEAMSPEETKAYIMSFVNDKRIPPYTLFNVFQMSLKAFNASGGTSDLSLLNYDESTGVNSSFYLNGLNLVSTNCDWVSSHHC